MKLNLLFFFLIITISLYAEEYKLYSPDKSIELTVEINESVYYSIKKNNVEFILPSRIGLTIDNAQLDEDFTKYKVKKDEYIGKIIPVIPIKNQSIEEHYHSLRIIFDNHYELEFRAYDDGIAYRFITDSRIKKMVIVNEETVEFNFADDYRLLFPEEESIFSHQERDYLELKLSEIDEERFASTPTLVDAGMLGKILITEAGLRDYPGMFLMGTDNENSLRGKFAHYPLEEKLYRDRDVKVEKYADYLAVTQPARVFPWRVMIIAEEDKDLINSELIYKLSPALELEDTEWIKPGIVAWDWWNALNIRDVDFESGVNTETYKYFIDFAAKYGLEYIILDEGWSETTDITKVVPEIDMQELTSYADEKDVGLILWVLWNSFDNKLDEALDLYSKWGVKGVKVDFMQRDDQKMVNYYWEVAEKAAVHKLLVDYHGSYKPTGLRRAYPNVITREGLKGNEHCKWSADITSEHNLTLPFIRMVAGPMDFTPGAMDNANPDNFFSRFTRPMSIGTRCHQLAMYVLYESPLQMLCDNPTNYLNEPECMKFLEKVPTVWDETIVIEAKLSDYLIIARRKGEVWYLGGMTDLTPRDFELSLDFLEDDKYSLQIWEDGINAIRDARDFKYNKKEINNGESLPVKLSSGGGFAAIIEPL